jgi:hypothetical protein
MNDGTLEATIVEKDRCDVCIAQDKIENQGFAPDPEALILNKTRATHKVICVENITKLLRHSLLLCKRWKIR